MAIIPSRFEQMTALTDFLVGCLASYAVSRLSSLAGFKPTIWMWAFALLAIAAFLGALAHGFSMTQKTNDLLWKPLNLTLGLAP